MKKAKGEGIITIAIGYHDTIEVVQQAIEMDNNLGVTVIPQHGNNRIFKRLWLRKLETGTS